MGELHLFDKWKHGLMNKKPVAILALCVSIIIVLGGVTAASGSIWDLGERIYHKWIEWNHMSNEMNRELEAKKKTFEEKRNIADKIFIEVLVNLKKIGMRSGVAGISQGDPDFQTVNYNKWYSNFGIGELDRQIENFYTNLRNNDVWSLMNENDLAQIKGQGEDVKRMLILYFCCKEYYHVRFQETRAVSQDTVEIISASAINSQNIASGATVEAAWRDSCFWAYLSATQGVEETVQRSP